MVGVVVLGVLTASAPVVAGGTITFAHYSIEVPRGYEARDVSPPMMDFELYRVTRQGSARAACTFYFGNAPNFPQLRWSERKAAETKGDNRTTTAFQRSDAIEGLIKFSGLSYKTSRSGSPWQSIHYLCDGLGEVEMKDALVMIASIKVVRPHVD